jgi:hypothetical protein
MLARRLDLATVLGYLWTVQTYFQSLFAHLGITSMAEWDPIETLNEATLCYVLAANLLGPRPQPSPRA